MAATFHVENFGCRAARADGEAVGDRLRAAGHSEQQPSAADVVVVNTCSVTAEADRAARAYIRRTHRLNPEARIVVTGCYAQRAPEELAAIDGVAAVVGNSHKALAPEIILGLVHGKAGIEDVCEMLPSGAEAYAPESGLLDELKSLREKDNFQANHTKSRTHGLKPDVVFEPFAARLKSCPDASCLSESVFAQPVTSCFDASCGHECVVPQPEKPVPFTRTNVNAAKKAGLIGVESLIAGGSAPIYADDRFAHSFLEEAQVTPGAQTRPNLNIQEGCGNRCSFCVIPFTRGPSKSLPAAAVLHQVEGFVAAGGKELVLSGINLGRWGRDRTDSTSSNEFSGDLWNRTLAAKTKTRRGWGTQGCSPRKLAALVRTILDETALARLRLSSIEPMDWSEELIGLMAEYGGARLARHAHLPLQSGSDAVLRRMYRRYRPWHYAAKVEALVKACGPELTVGADVMVGFPGESEAEFGETLTLIRALPFGYLHLFPFSPRPGTPGWALHAARPVAAEAVAERMAALRALAAEKMQAHRRSFAGRELEAITLHTQAELAAQGHSAALTENFLPVELDSRMEANRLVRLRVSGVNAEGVLTATQS